MGRPKVEIKGIRGKRLKQICEEQNITQQTLSSKVYISQQAISNMVTGQANVTEVTARKVIEYISKELHFDYRFEWLMGYDDYKTESDKQSAEFKKQYFHWKNINSLHRAGINSFALSCGFEVEESESGEWILKKDSQRVQLTMEQAINLESEISNFIEYRLNKLFK